MDDGLLVQVSHDQAGCVLRLTLRCGHLQMGDYELALTYEGAEITLKHEWELARLARSTVDAWHAPDLRRHEVDVIDDGKIEHRLEFHDNEPDNWFAIRCGAMKWEIVSRPDRELPALPDRFLGGPATEATQ